MKYQTKVGNILRENNWPLLLLSAWFSRKKRLNPDDTAAPKAPPTLRYLHHAALFLCRLGSCILLYYQVCVSCLYLSSSTGFSFHLMMYTSFFFIKSWTLTHWETLPQLVNLSEHCQTHPIPLARSLQQWSLGSLAMIKETSYVMGIKWNGYLQYTPKSLCQFY